ncbi:proton-conducting transporter membrane subunit [Pseudoroseomonas cervicalis]|uniref:proton-conducting transporter transmembrane domain-containing protein n=1 Tax=Teichococcus cervicalis TaxID=204525 RepID=UPI0022F18A10|nr:proton-conducting transporter membrane subunit [Pseudoroseomonas cervicalis]WBV43956.1 proton-conducting transporter membrane subunit [Pseudoroseomonas cervicalis]
MLTEMSGLLLALLLLLALAGGVRARLAPLALGGSALASAGLALAGLAALLGGEAPPLLLPVGPAWAPLTLGLDGLSAWFLLPFGLCGMAASLAALPPRQGAGRREGGPGEGGWPALLGRASPGAWPLLLAAAALALLAGDGFTLLLGVLTAPLAAWPLLAGVMPAAPAAPLVQGFALNSVPPAPPVPDAPRWPLGLAALGAACLAPAIGLMAGLAGDLSFAGLRAAPPQGGTALAVLALVLLGAATLPAALPALPVTAPSPVAMLLAAALGPLPLYLVARLLLDLGGLGQGLSWGAPLLLLGAVAALFGALRAARAAELNTVLAWSGLGQAGLVVLAFGLSAILRAADLGPLAALAAGAGLLQLLGLTLAQVLLWLAAGEVRHGAGSLRLDRLGGLIHVMPRLSLAALAGAATAAALPPLAGFAAQWLLLQALLSAWRVGELGLQLLLAAAVGLIGMAAALAGFAMLRLWGLAFLGRPRAPRTLGAQEAPPATLALLFALAGAGLLVGLLPGPLLVLGGPAVALLSGHPGGLSAASLWAVRASDVASAYHPLGLALLLGLVFLALAAALRLLSPRPSRRGPVWDGGFVAPPPHLPFGDPATQPSAEGFAQPARRGLEALLPDAARWRGALSAALARRARLSWPRLSRHRPPGALLLPGFAALLLLLALLGAGGGR